MKPSHDALANRRAANAENARGQCLREESMAAQNGRGIGTSRRRFLTGGAAAGTSLAFAAPAVYSQAAPFRVGIMNTYTGVNAIAAEANLKGINFYFDRINW